MAQKVVARIKYELTLEHWAQGLAYSKSVINVGYIIFYCISFNPHNNLASLVPTTLQTGL